jgi:hypothetical protein
MDSRLRGSDGRKLDYFFLHRKFPAQIFIKRLMEMANAAILILAKLNPVIGGRN